MKLIFADFDGVLNSRQSWKDGVRDKMGIAALSPEHVSRINSIVNNTGAKVVVSSSWREFHSPEEIDQFLTEAGFTGEVIGSTPVGGWCRADEISSWIEHNRGVTGNDFRFVILDDNSLCEDDTQFSKKFAHLKNRFIQTDWQYGLQNHHVQIAIKMLNNEM